MAKRLIFYYNHYNTLGHSTRVFSLVAGLKRHYRDKIDIAVLQGGRRQPLLPLDKYAKVFLLPYSMDRRGLFVEEHEHFYQKMIIHKRLDSMLRQRLRVIRKVINDYKPDLFISEYFPFGKEFWTFEVPHILEYLKENFKCKIVSSSGYLSCIENTYQCIRDYYDMLLIHSPQDFAKDYPLYLHKNGVSQIRRVFDEFSDKIKFTGFVLDEPRNDSSRYLRKIHLGSRYKHLVLVSRGGGIVNKKIIIASMLAAKKLKNTCFIICCGPATTEKEFSQYMSISKSVHNITLRKEIPIEQFGAYLEACDLSISMAGYNTTVKLLYYGKKSILVPFETYEQLWRAELVSRYLPVRIIKEEKLSASQLTDAIGQLLEERVFIRSDNRDWFSGVAQTISILKCVV